MTENQKKRLAVLVSGSGTNLQAIIDAIKSKELEKTEITLVISNKKEAFALERIKKEKIEGFFFNPADFKTNLDYDKEIIKWLNQKKIDLIILAGYTKILTTSFINSFQNKIINIHPSLLPSFGGKGMYGQKVHEAVLKSGITESGCTVHFVTEEIDRGPIIAQRKVPVLKGDTIDTLSKRVLTEEHKLLIDSIKKVLFEEPVALLNKTSA